MQMNSFYKLGLLFLMEVARYVQSTQNRKLVIFCVLLWCKTFRCFMGVQPCLLLLVFLHSRPDCRNFLSEHCNIMSRQHLCGEGFPPSLSLLQVDVFQENQGILQQIILFPSNKPKKACIRFCDRNNFTQSLTRKHHHTVIESLYLLCGAKIS